MPPKIMLPLNLAEVAYRLQITTDVQFEAAERIAEEHHIQNIGMTIDSVTMWERFCGVQYGPWVQKEASVLSRSVIMKPSH